jgi:hypothetical protein
MSGDELLTNLSRDRTIGERHELAVCKANAAHVDGIGAAVLGDAGAGDTVAPTAIERVEIVELVDCGAGLGGDPRHVAANPFGNRRGHRAAQRRRGLQRHAALVGQDHRLEADDIVAAAGARPHDRRQRRGDRDVVGERQPACRRLRSGCLGRLLINRFLRSILCAWPRLRLGFWRLRRPRPWQRHARSCERDIAARQEECAGPAGQCQGPRSCDQADKLPLADTAAYKIADVRRLRQLHPSHAWLLFQRWNRNRFAPYLGHAK